MSGSGRSWSAATAASAVFSNLKSFIALPFTAFQSSSNPNIATDKLESSSSQPQPQPMASEEQVARQEHASHMLATHGIKVRDFAYESNLPKIRSVPRPAPTKPLSRGLKRARDFDATYETGASTSSAAAGMGVMDFGVEHYEPRTYVVTAGPNGKEEGDRPAKRARKKLERENTEPCIGSQRAKETGIVDSRYLATGVQDMGVVLSVGNTTGARATTPPQRNPLSRGHNHTPKKTSKSTGRVNSTAISLLTPPSQPCLSQGSDWIDTPLVTPNGSYLSGSQHPTTAPTTSSSPEPDTLPHSYASSPVASPSPAATDFPLLETILLQTQSPSPSEAVSIDSLAVEASSSSSSQVFPSTITPPPALGPAFVLDRESNASQSPLRLLSPLTPLPSGYLSSSQPHSRTQSRNHSQIQSVRSHPYARPLSRTLSMRFIGSTSSLTSLSQAQNVLSRQPSATAALLHEDSLRLEVTPPPEESSSDSRSHGRSVRRTPSLSIKTRVGRYDLRQRESDGSPSSPSLFSSPAGRRRSSAATSSTSTGRSTRSSSGQASVSSAKSKAKTKASGKGKPNENGKRKSSLSKGAGEVGKVKGGSLSGSGLGMVLRRSARCAGPGAGARVRR